jgi:hypothetical protein
MQARFQWFNGFEGQEFRDQNTRTFPHHLRTISQELHRRSAGTLFGSYQISCALQYDHIETRLKIPKIFRRIFFISSRRSSEVERTLFRGDGRGIGSSI